jgi:hypothetical protein
MLQSRTPAGTSSATHSIHTVNWELWLDYHRIDDDGLTHTNVRNLERQTPLSVGEFVTVGNEEADPAVAEVVEIADDGFVRVRVLRGPAEDHLHLVAAHRAS